MSSSLGNILFYIGIHISFVSGKSIHVDDQALTTLASSPARYSSFTIYKAGLFAVINGTHFHLRWDFGRKKKNERFESYSTGPRSYRLNSYIDHPEDDIRVVPAW